MVQDEKQRLESGSGMTRNASLSGHTSPVNMAGGKQTVFVNEVYVFMERINLFRKRAGCGWLSGFSSREGSRWTDCGSVLGYALRRYGAHLYVYTVCIREVLLLLSRGV